MREAGDAGKLKNCSVDGCDRRTAARGMCDWHYRRHLRFGTADPPTLLNRFNTKYEVQPNGCWRWTDSLRAGYGSLKVDGRRLMAHRVAYQLLVGPIPERLQIDHLCRNKLCVNPTHLEAVTQQENILRSDNMAAKWARRTVCHKCGGELKPLNTRRARVCWACRNERVRRSKEKKRAGG